jgi:hypothetical protein
MLKPWGHGCLNVVLLSLIGPRSVCGRSTVGSMASQLCAFTIATAAGGSMRPSVGCHCPGIVWCCSLQLHWMPLYLWLSRASLILAQVWKLLCVRAASYVVWLCHGAQHRGTQSSSRKAISKAAAVNGIGLLLSGLLHVSSRPAASQQSCLPAAEPRSLTLQRQTFL